ncbi:hypothetical protein GCM10010168_58830 [Actinoplanes ianthinogenes]|uniref:Uncharacterized protein n=1 Tax=Actinoplanes ianthinogenes TaxID=122358 RepID=A0ABM7M288_9ACTN|nr:hypothetical protein Aiant_63530 [Actinoplanes ianthinogenes]GGR32609.1 hypothetical protein GCM10010168_58830 [Actinoplanes ianthinogenes]
MGLAIAARACGADRKTDVMAGGDAPRGIRRSWRTSLERAISDTMRKPGHDRTALDEIPADSGGGRVRRGPGHGRTHPHTRARGAAESGAITRTRWVPRSAPTDFCQAGHGGPARLPRPRGNRPTAPRHARRQGMDAAWRTSR